MKKLNYFKTGKKQKRKDKRRQEAFARAKAPSPELGLKQQVRKGLITPKDALTKLVDTADDPKYVSGTKTVRWLTERLKKKETK